jgi:hypothetical protein
MQQLDMPDMNVAAIASDDAKFFIANYSRVDYKPASALISATGKRTELEEADFSELFAAGYKFPERFVVKAADGITDLHGAIYKPFDFDSTKVYALADYVYPGPQVEGNTVYWSSGMTRTDRLAQLGVLSEKKAERLKGRPIKQTLKIETSPNGCQQSRAPFFCDYVVNWLLKDPVLGDTVKERRRTLNTGGLIINTTIDLDMQKAADEFEKVLADVEFADPKIHLFSNVTGKEVVKGADAKASAVLHLTHPVLWTDEEAVLANIVSVEGGVDSWSVIEPGPGKVLSGLWGQTEFGASLASSPVNTWEAVSAL